ncbi:MAG: PAS domain S-box protein [Bacteroidales bacterium]
MRGRGKNLNCRLAESEIPYKSVFDHSIDGILLTAPDGRILVANPAACRMFGRSEEDLCRLGRDGILNVDDPRLASAVEHRKQTGEFVGELTGLRADGTLFPLELTTSVFTDINGELRTSMIIRDISFRKRFREELDSRESHMRSMLENSEDSIWSVDNNFRLLDGNSAFQARFQTWTGRRISPGENVLDLLPEEIRDQWRKYLIRGLKGTSFTTMSSIGTGPEIKYLRYSFNPVRNMTGEVTGLAVMGSDVTDMMVMQKDLVRTGVMLKEAQSVAKLGNWEYDLVQNKADWSDELLRIFGLTRTAGEPSWDSHLKRIHPDDLQQFEESVMRAYSEGIPFESTFRVQIPGEEIKWIRAICQTGKDRQGHVVRLFGTVQDLTDTMKYEEGLLEAGDTLRRLNLHIEEAREMERTHIAMNLHDDLGQKLTALQMNLSWLSKRIGVQSELVSEKLVEIEHMIRNSISTVQKISSELRPAILYDLGLKEAVEWHMRQNLEPSGIRGSFRMMPADLKIDEKRSIVLFRIIQEGLTNIIRHSGADRADVRIAGSISFLELVIKDNGKGIDATTVNDSRSFGITGIKERVKSFSGDFSISGEPGHGTTLTVKIPLTKNAISR